MDVKDINNMVTTVAGFGRVSAQSNAAAMGQNFAGLIAQAGDMSAELMPSLSGEKKTSAPVEKRMSQPKNGGLENVRSDSRNEKGRREASKVSAPEKKSVDKKRKSSAPNENASVGSEQKMNVEKTPVQSQRDENEAVAAAVDGVAMAADDVAGAQVEDNAVLAAVDFVPVMAADDFAQPSDVVLSDVDVEKATPLDALVKEMSPVEGLDAELDVELADLLQQPQMKIEDSGENVAEKNTASSQETRDIADIENPAEQEIVAEETAQSQGAEIAEVLGDKQKLKIDVDVKEEKISYLSGQDLVKNRQALDDAIASVEANENEVASQSFAEQQPIVTADNAQNSPVAAFSAFVSGENLSLNATSASEENISVSATQTASAEVINNGLTGAEAERKSSDVSFRDVYKGMSKEVVEQVKVNITKSAVKGVDTINVRLKPEDLGHIEIKMQIKDGKLQAHIISSRPETAEILQKEADALEKAFNDAGFQTDGDSLNFSFREDNQANQNKEKNSDLRNFMGEIFENETNGDLDAVAGEYMWNGNRGLNIRV